MLRRGGVKRSWRRVLRYEIVEFFDGLPPLQCLTRPAIQLCGDPIELGLRMQRQVGALREVLPEQAVGVLVRTTLPRRMRVAEIHRDPVRTVKSACRAISLP